MWTSFITRPSQPTYSFKDEFVEFYDKVETWIKENKTKSYRIKILNLNTYIAPQTIEDIRIQRSAHVHANIQIKFRSKRDATLFKLFFTDNIFPDTVFRNGAGIYSPVILPIIRRIMPTILAHEICGSQPMTGPVGSAFALKVQYSKKQKTKQKNGLKIIYD